MTDATVAIPGKAAKSTGDASGVAAKDTTAGTSFVGIQLPTPAATVQSASNGKLEGAITALAKRFEAAKPQKDVDPPVHDKYRGIFVHIAAALDSFPAAMEPNERIRSAAMAGYEVCDNMDHVFDSYEDKAKRAAHALLVEKKNALHAMSEYVKTRGEGYKQAGEEFPSTKWSAYMAVKVQIETAADEEARKAGLNGQGVESNKGKPMLRVGSKPDAAADQVSVPLRTEGSGLDQAAAPVLTPSAAT